MLKKKIYQQHIKELKYKFLYFNLSLVLTWLCCFYYKIGIFLIFVANLFQWNKKFIFTHLSTGFFLTCQLTFICSLIVTLPLLFYFIYLFIVTSFSIYQKTSFLSQLIFFNIFNIFFVFTLVLFILPFLLNFFLSFEINFFDFQVSLEPRIDQYIHFLLKIFACYVSFSCFIFIFIYFSLYWFNFFYLWVFKFLFYFIFILFLSPPEPLLQFILFIILFIIFETYFYIFKIVSYLFVTFLWRE